ncbi:hypothetical protein [Streptomyces parvulus]|uniref:zinc finger domain-containing protein n=1 Tax=Streptomyces parvulus TaxID=146923 RepID=UPI00380A7C54
MLAVVVLRGEGDRWNAEDRWARLMAGLDAERSVCAGCRTPLELHAGRHCEVSWTA